MAAMIFTLQHYLEDRFNRRHLDDNDQYAVALANLIAKHRGGAKRNEFVRRMARIRTTFYQNNSGLSRRDFENELLASVEKKYPSLKKNFRRLKSELCRGA